MPTYDSVHWVAIIAPAVGKAGSCEIIIFNGDCWDRATKQAKTCEGSPFGYQVHVRVRTTARLERDNGPENIIEDGDRIATLLNLSPWQAWVHLYCQEEDVDDSGKCHVAFRCNGMEGEAVSWAVEVDQYRIFSYWPTKPVDLYAALIEAGKTEAEAHKRHTCEVFSDDEVTVRGYTLFGGQPTLTPVAVYD